MNSRNQKRPAPRSAVRNNQAVDDDKLTKSGIGWIMASTTAINNQKDVTVDWEIVEFTKEQEEVDVVLNDKFKGKTFEDLVKEKDHLHKMLYSSERKRMEAEAAMSLKEEELNSTIIKLENNISSLKENLANEESQKLDAIDQLNKEKEANMTLKKDHEILKKKLLTTWTQNSSTANQKVKQQEDMYKKLQDYNTSLQQYNTKLQTELKTATESNKQVEKEKTAILENHTTLKGHHTLLQNELTSAKESRDDAVKQKESAVKEVQVLRCELQQVKEDRELVVSRMHDLNAEIMRYKESTGRTAETSSAQRELISVLQLQLDNANKKLKELKGKNIWYQ